MFIDIRLIAINQIQKIIPYNFKRITKRKTIKFNPSFKATISDRNTLHNLKAKNLHLSVIHRIIAVADIIGVVI